MPTVATYQPLNSYYIYHPISKKKKVGGNNSPRVKNGEIRRLYVLYLKMYYI